MTNEVYDRFCYKCGTHYAEGTEHVCPPPKCTRCYGLTTIGIGINMRLCPECGGTGEASK